MKQKFLKIGSFLVMAATVMFVAFSTTSCQKDKVDISPSSFSEVSADGATLQLSVSSNTDWSVTADQTWVTLSPTSGSNDATVSLTVAANTGAARTATVTVTGGDITKTATVSQLAATVVETVPADAGTIQGPDEADDYADLSVAAIEGATSYKWYLDGTAITGATANTHRATVSGTYTVAGVNSVGEGKASPEKVVTINSLPLPDAAGEIQGASEGEGSVELTIAAINNASGYRWYKDGVAVQESTSRTYTANASGTYQVAGYNNTGEGQKSPDKVVTITQIVTIDSYIGEWQIDAMFYNTNTDERYAFQYFDEMQKVTGNTADGTVDLGVFTNFIDAYWEWILEWDEASKSFMSKQFMWAQPVEGYPSDLYFMILPGNFDGDSIYFVDFNWDDELFVTLDENGKLIVPKEWDGAPGADKTLYYSVWAYQSNVGWDKRYSHYLYNIEGTKVSGTSMLEGISLNINNVNIPFASKLPEGAPASVKLSDYPVVERR